MSDCGHASGVTYAGCMKCDLDKLKERNSELKAENKIFRASEGCKESTWDYVIHEIQKQLDINEKLKARIEAVKTLMQSKRDIEWATHDGGLPIDLRDFFDDLDKALNSGVDDEQAT